MSKSDDTISRQAVIELVKGSYYDLAGSMDDVWSMVAEVEGLPSVTVDKEYLIDLIQEAVYDGEACAKLIDMVDRPIGKWVEVEAADGDLHYQCDQCKGEFVLIDGTPEENNYWYCPNCGSRNVREDGEEE